MVDTRVRPIADGDVPGFLQLYRTHLGTIASEIWDTDWFRWKYEENPNVRETAVMVAEHDGQVVGGLGLMPTEMRFRDVSFVGVQPVDIVVHPDYRDANLFYELVDRGLSRFGMDDPWFVYGQPRAESLDAWTRLRGWEHVREVPRSWRIQRIHAFVADMLESRSLAALAALSQPFFSVSLERPGSRHVPSETRSTITEHSQPPVERLAGLYERRRPEGLHVVRDRAFYQWRMVDAPHAEYRTYLAERDGSLVGALTVSWWRSQNAVKIVDHLPLSPSSPDDVAVLRDLIAGAIRANADASAIRASLCLPEEIVAEFGFDHTRKMNEFVGQGWVPEQLTNALPSWNIHLAGRPTDGADLSADARAELVDWESWQFTGIEIDTD